MTTINQKQVTQSLNIVNTIIEATEHFQGLAKEKEVNQSIFIFGSIVDGIQALTQYGYINSTHKNLAEKLEKNILLIAKNIEDAKFAKIQEITQFSFIPNLNKLKHLLEDSSQESTEVKKLRIGVYGFRNPLDFYPKPRIDAMVEESEKQNNILYFFGDDDVNFSEETIHATFYQNGEKKQEYVSFPDVINNTSTKKTHTSRKLHRMIPFTNYFFVGNKVSLPERLLQTGNKYVRLLVPFQQCQSIEQIHTFLANNPKVVFKHLRANRGENIYFVTKKNQRYILLVQKKETILTAEGFDKWLNNVILKENNSYIIQKYIHTRTKNNEPFHIRAHVQKNADGDWQLTYIYPRIGNKKSNLSNISTEGRIENFQDFLIEQYGEKQGKKYTENILELSIDVAWNLDKLYGMAIDELGLDFAIDDKGRIWMHEANNGPQTAFHEEKRAVNTIAYAKYIYENGIVHSVSANSLRYKNQFNARTSNLSTRKDKNQIVLGLIVPSIQKTTPLQKALLEAAEDKNTDICLIRPSDIDFENMLIRGHFNEEDEWKPYISSYPDIIFDRLKAKENEGLQIIYEEFEDIPFINSWSNQILNVTSLYERLKEDNNLTTLLPDYSRVKKVRDVFHWVNTYHLIKLTLEATREVMYVYQLPNNKFELLTRKGTKIFSEFQLKQHFQKNLSKKRVMVEAAPKHFPMQQFTLHLMKDLNSNNWNLVDIIYKNCNHPNELVHQKIVSALHPNVEVHNLDAIKDNLVNSSKSIADILQNVQSTSLLTELEVSFAIDAEQNVTISSVNTDHPAYLSNLKQYAKLVFELGKQLISLEK